MSCSFVCACMCMCVGVRLERPSLWPTECVTGIFSSNAIISLIQRKEAMKILCLALTSSAPIHQVTGPETSSPSDRYSFWQCWLLVRENPLVLPRRSYSLFERLDTPWTIGVRMWCKLRSRGAGSGVGPGTSGLDLSFLPSPKQSQLSKIRMKVTSLTGWHL